MSEERDEQPAVQVSDYWVEWEERRRRLPLAWAATCLAPSRSSGRRAIRDAAPGPDELAHVAALLDAAPAAPVPARWQGSGEYAGVVFRHPTLSDVVVVAFRGCVASYREGRGSSWPGKPMWSGEDVGGKVEAWVRDLISTDPREAKLVEAVQRTTAYWEKGWLRRMFASRP